MAAGDGITGWQRVFPPYFCLMLCSFWSEDALGRSSLKQRLPVHLFGAHFPLASWEEQHSLQSLSVPRGLAAPSTGQQYPVCMGQDETLSRKHQVLRVDVLSPKGGRAAPGRGLYPQQGYVISSS